jgi:hypothetical protein
VADTLPGFDADPVDDVPDDIDELEELEELEPQSGLGRGLAAIIPTLADLDSPTPPKRRGRRRGGIEAMLAGGSTDPAPPTPAPEVDADPAPPTPTPTPTPDAELAEAAAPVSATPSAPVHVPAPSAVRKLRDDLVGALLDGLANTMALDLCAYLHAGPGEEPHLFLQSPSLDAIGPARAYLLIDGLRRELEAGRANPELSVAGFEGVSVATLGEGSRGVWAVARTEGITVPEREVASRFCRSFGRAVHQLDGAASPANTLATPALVRVHRARDSVLAEVEVRLGDQIRPGRGRADTRVEAITRAVLVAAGRQVTFRYASEVAHEGEHAAVVLLESADHAVSLGSALSAEAGGVATAQAAIRALDGLAA